MFFPSFEIFSFSIIEYPTNACEMGIKVKVDASMLEDRSTSILCYTIIVFYFLYSLGLRRSYHAVPFCPVLLGTTEAYTDNNSSNWLIVFCMNKACSASLTHFIFYWNRSDVEYGKFSCIVSSQLTLRITFLLGLTWVPHLKSLLRPNCLRSRFETQMTCCRTKNEY